MNHLLNLFKPSTLCSGRPRVLLGMMLLLAFHAKAQTTLTGTVISDSDNEPLIGVSVMEQNSQNGQVTDVPEGVQTSYNILIPADGVGDHPAYEILTGAKSALEQMGITLEIRDVRNVSDIWSGLRSGNVEMWCGAWSAQADPDLYPVYYSGVSRNGENAGASSYMYGIRDLVLDEMILMAREGDSRVYRKALYKACLDTIMEWACVVPTYQRKDAVVVRTGSVEIETLPTDMTAFYCWDAQLQDLELQ